MYIDVYREKRTPLSVYRERAQTYAHTHILETERADACGHTDILIHTDICGY
jgi:hypothetical protein